MERVALTRNLYALSLNKIAYSSYETLHALRKKVDWKKQVIDWLKTYRV